MICSGDQPAGSDLLHLGDDCESKGSSALPGDHQHHDNDNDDHEQPPKADHRHHHRIPHDNDNRPGQFNLDGSLSNGDL